LQSVIEISSDHYIAASMAKRNGSMRGCRAIYMKSTAQIWAMALIIGAVAFQTAPYAFGQAMEETQTKDADHPLDPVVHVNATGTDHQKIPKNESRANPAMNRNERSERDESIDDPSQIRISIYGEITTAFGQDEDGNPSDIPAAFYRITIENKGPKTVEGLEISDMFPNGARFISSTLRPSWQALGYANWTIGFLGAGQIATIGLYLDVTGAKGDLLNRVYANVVDKSRIMAGNMIEQGGLNCCGAETSLRITAQADDSRHGIVDYRLTVRNTAGGEVFARIVDLLPEGMSLVDAVPWPQDHLNGVLLWMADGLKPDEVWVVNFTAKAERDGVYTNRAEVEAYMLDGSCSASKTATSSIDVRGTGREPYTTDYGGWQPPQWGQGVNEEGLQM
jgi:uncharacterized repeat protein (TIGR01451 family)